MPFKFLLGVTALIWLASVCLASELEPALEPVPKTAVPAATPAKKRDCVPQVLDLLPSHGQYSPHRLVIPVLGDLANYERVTYSTLRLKKPSPTFENLEWSVAAAGGGLITGHEAETVRRHQGFSYPNPQQLIFHEMRLGRIQFLGESDWQDTEFYVKYVFNLKGQPKVYVSPLTSDSPIAKEMDQRLGFVFDRFHQEKIVSDKDIGAFGALEKTLHPARKTLITFLDPSSENTKAVVRIYDGSLDRDSFLNPDPPLPLANGAANIPIEREYPFLELPERTLQKSRKPGEYGAQYQIFELGRGAGDPDSKGVLTSLFSAAAQHLELQYSAMSTAERHFPESSIIYIEGNEKGKNAYVEMGFEVAYGPKELRIPEGQPAKYVLRMKTNAFYERYGKVTVVPHPKTQH